MSFSVALLHFLYPSRPSKSTKNKHFHSQHPGVRQRVEETVRLKKCLNSLCNFKCLLKQKTLQHHITPLGSAAQSSEYNSPLKVTEAGMGFIVSSFLLELGFS